MVKIKKLNFQKVLLETDGTEPKDDFVTKFFSVICHQRPKVMCLKISDEVFNKIIKVSTYFCSCQDKGLHWRIMPVWLAPDFESNKGLSVELELDDILYRFTVQIDEISFLSLINGFILVTKQSNNDPVFHEKYLAYAIDFPTNLLHSEVFKLMLDKLIISKKQELRDALL